MEIINKNVFDETIQSGVVMVDFFATWCGPCKMLGPVLEELSKKYEGRMNIVKVDVDQDQELAMRYGIMSVPTMIIFKDGQPVKQIQGFQPQPALENIINSVL